MSHFMQVLGDFRADSRALSQLKATPRIGRC